MLGLLLHNIVVLYQDLSRNRDLVCFMFLEFNRLCRPLRGSFSTDGDSQFGEKRFTFQLKLLPYRGLCSGTEST
ncbi:hypothetical protein LshimejAT787_1801640 [Lyophyllum shimeji]|uniref:Uncharacterized protein n=1 Tax=Lyophyllum shimeji TaxID=47721 RepID=A0A9P3PXG7_LYOSH|nr:hypothetical protein LshimejAT787_1801640 [Lyophyllum shimeji]